jgi:hypothetical protein
MAWDLVALELETGKVRELLRDASQNQPTPVGARHVVLTNWADQPNFNDLRIYDVQTGRVAVYPGAGRMVGWPWRAVGGVLPAQTAPPKTAPKDTPRFLRFVDLEAGKVLSHVALSGLGGANRLLPVQSASFDGRRFVVWALHTWEKVPGQSPTERQPTLQCGYWLVDAATGKAQYLAAPLSLDPDRPTAPEVAKLQPILPPGAEPLGWASADELVISTTGRDVQVFDLRTGALRKVMAIPGKDAPATG